MDSPLNKIGKTYKSLNFASENTKLHWPVSSILLGYIFIIFLLVFQFCVPIVSYYRHQSNSIRPHYRHI